MAISFWGMYVLWPLKNSQLPPSDFTSFMLTVKENPPMPTTVLIADDDTVSRGLIRMVLEYDGCRCLEAEDGTATLSV